MYTDDYDPTPLDDELEEEAILDAILLAADGADSSGVFVINPSGLKRFQQAGKIARAITAGTRAKAICKQQSSDLFVSCGTISIIGEKIEIGNPLLFAALGKLSSTMEMYSKTNGEVQINYTFEDITKEI